MQTILLVDDDPSILRAWRRVLQLEGYQVETAANGEAGLIIARTVQPILVIADQSMPGMGGIELCHRLKRDSKLAGIPAVLASAEDETALVTPPWDEFWSKLILIEAMRSSIRRLVAPPSSEGLQTELANNGG
jgi:CheY-like chemotaxis protein